MTKFLSALLVTGVSVCGASANANSVTGTMPVTVTAVSSCAVAAAPLVFGPLNPVTQTQTDSQTTVTVTCSPGIVYDVGMDMGTHQSGSTRYMQAALTSAVIPYSIYTNASRTSPWGMTVGTDTVHGTASSTPTTLNVYGRIPASVPLVAAGVYSDVVTVSVFF